MNTPQQTVAHKKSVAPEGVVHDVMLTVFSRAHERTQRAVNRRHLERM